jgi:hypothetical protein
MSKLAFRAQTVDIAYLPLRQGFLAKNVLMTAQRDYGFTSSLYWFYWFQWLERVAGSVRDLRSLRPTNQTNKTNQTSKTSKTN